MGFVNLVSAPGLAQALRPDHRPGPAMALPLPGLAWHIPGLIAPEELQLLQATGLRECDVPVGLDGILSHYTPGDPIGSWRATLFEPGLAQLLWLRLEPVVPKPLRCDALMHVDWDQHPAWQPDGVNPAMRFIRYRPGEGQLVAHYDAPYIESPARRTLFTVLLYLSDVGNGGETRFLHDPQDELPFEQRDFADKPSLAKDADVQFVARPRAGDALLFEHRLLHDGNRFAGKRDKLVLRTDLFFSRA